MWIQCILFLTPLTYALGLECYATNLLKAESTKTLKKGTYLLQNCTDIIRNAYRLQGMAHVNLPSNLEYSCYTLFVNTEAVDVRLKGCIPVGSCGVLRESVRYKTEQQSKLIKIEDINCVECTVDACNGVEAFSVSHLAITIERNSAPSRYNNVKNILVTILLLVTFK